MICLESTTYPGTTEEVVLPRLARGGLTVGRDFFPAYSPEREDPGNPAYSTALRGEPLEVHGDGRRSRDFTERLTARVDVGDQGFEGEYAGP